MDPMADNLSITELVREILSKDGGRGARDLAKSLIDVAAKGNAAVAKVLFDRIDGPLARDEEIADSLSDEERIARIGRLLDRARERRDRQSGLE
ncbi:MAG: hypothetical protein IH945_13925 [Armatimonadetes bacterium]|nr:hypothetical protein [Armatimonadota bacterium]